MILHLLRLVRLIRMPTISKEDALRLAREECDRRGWPWQEPIEISDGIRCWNIVTHAGWVDSNVLVVVDNCSGKLIGADRTGRARTQQ